ncbi:MAG: aminopeptidase P family protein [Desulfobacterales bacterium]|nr:aminopeptidase P family protein [Desulfobacterales bacterium]
MNKDIPDIFKDRLAQVRKSLSDRNLDALMVLVEENRRYLCGFTGEDTQFDESAGALIVTRSECILATDSRFTTQAEREVPFCDIFCYPNGLMPSLPGILIRLQSKSLGFESSRVSYAAYQKMTSQLDSDQVRIDLMPCENIVEDLRIIKEEAEIKAIQASLGLAESAFQSIAGMIQPGISEKDLAWSLEKALREAGADALSFPAIVASGPNSALPHAIPSERKLEKGEPVLFDWGARLNGYCSDISRMRVAGAPGPTFLKVFDIVRAALENAIEAIRPGKSSKAIDAVARTHIEKHGYKDNFGHGLGHGVGCAVHELPRVSPTADTILAPGMVFTVEPGIYLPGWGGIRLENMVVVRENGAEVLNHMDFNTLQDN